MDAYKQLQFQIESLNADYNKDEAELESDLRELETKNRDSIRKYKETKGKALKLKEELTALALSSDLN
jgi:hypothetical protein